MADILAANPRLLRFFNGLAINCLTSERGSDMFQQLGQGVQDETVALGFSSCGTFSPSPADGERHMTYAGGGLHGIFVRAGLLGQSIISQTSTQPKPLTFVAPDFWWGHHELNCSSVPICRSYLCRRKSQPLISSFKPTQNLRPNNSRNLNGEPDR